MEFKRLNNMTGRDPILNRRIATILINQMEEFKQMLTSFEENELSNIEFTMHKIRPSLLIFEMDTIIKHYSEMMEIWQKNGQSVEMSTQKGMVIQDLDLGITHLKNFLSIIP